MAQFSGLSWKKRSDFPKMVLLQNIEKFAKNGNSDFPIRNIEREIRLKLAKRAKRT
jgi:hypothetical protein